MLTFCVSSSDWFCTLYAAARHWPAQNVLGKPRYLLFICRGKIHFDGHWNFLEGVGPENQDFCGALKWQRAKRVLFGTKNSRCSPVIGNRHSVCTLWSQLPCHVTCWVQNCPLLYAVLGTWLSEQYPITATISSESKTFKNITETQISPIYT